MTKFVRCNDPKCVNCRTLDADDEFVSAFPKIAENSAYGKPSTGTGDAPMKAIVIDLPTPNPETVADYMAWVKFRTATLGRWIKMDAPEAAPLILETIARVEGDLQQIRHLVKAGKDTTDRVDDILSHLTAFSIDALDKIMEANGETE
jgi:hypothetical protein